MQHETSPTKQFYKQLSTLSWTPLIFRGNIAIRALQYRLRVIMICYIFCILNQFFTFLIWSAIFIMLSRNQIHVTIKLLRQSAYNPIINEKF